MRVTDETVRAWARAGVIRHVAEGRPLRFLLCEEDVDELAELLRDVRKPTLALVRVLKRSR